MLEPGFLCNRTLKHALAARLETVFARLETVSGVPSN